MKHKKREAKGNKNNQYLTYEKKGKIDNIRIIKRTELIKNSFINIGKYLLLIAKNLIKPIKKEVKNRKVVKSEGLIPKGLEMIKP